MNDSPSLDVLPDGRVVLSLAGACIQTSAKRAHRDLSSALLEGRAAGGAAQAALDTLARFLSTTDFASLRARCPDLAGGVACRVRLRAFDDGTVGWEAEKPV